MYAYYPKVIIKLTFTVENDKFEYLLCQPFSAFLDTLYFCCVHEHLKFNRFNNSFLSCLPKIVINASNRCTSILNKDLYSLNKNHFSNPRSTPIICLPPRTPEKNLTTGPEISEGSIFLACSSPPLSVMDLVRLTEDEGRGGARDFLLPSFPRKLLRLVARGSSIFSAVTASLSSFLSSFGSVGGKGQKMSKSGERSKVKHLTKN